MKRRSTKATSGAPGVPAAMVAAAAPIRRTRDRWFRGVLLLSPVLLLVLVEAALRLAGSGNPTAFFLRVHQNGQEKLIQNPRFGWRFFPPSLARSPLPVSLSASKPGGAIRVFVLGESAAMGDPEPAYGLSRQLEQLLWARHPEKKIEVVNVAMTAINSHVIRDIASDCASARGDCWVIYAGNNEVVGPFGAGTIFGRQAPALPAVRLNLALKRTRIGQVLGSIGQEADVPAEWQGMEMFLQQQVMRDDPRLSRVYRNFERNLEAIIDSGTRSGAKVVVATMAVNLRECPPFGSSHRPGLSAEQTAEWENRFLSGREAERDKRYIEALAAYQRAAEIDAEYAGLVYRRAACKLASGDAVGAGADYGLARDLDTLRFRADSRLNDIVRRIAGAKRVPLVDAEKECARRAAGKDPSSTVDPRPSTPVPGEDLFYDHVHLNFAGTYWLAALLLPEIERELFGPATNTGPAVLPETEVAGRLAFTDHDRRLVFEEMRARLQQPPFKNQSNFQDRDAAWGQRLESLNQPPQAGIPQYKSALNLAPADWVLHSRFGQLLEAAHDEAAAAVQWQEVARLMPHEPEAFYHLGNLAQDRGAYDEAERLFREALEKRPESTEALNGLGLVARFRQRADEARGCFEAALKLNPRYAGARINLAVLLAENGKVPEAKNHYAALLRIDTNNVAARINLARLLTDEGRREEAISLYKEAVRLQPGNAVARYNLANALCAQQKNAEAIPHYRAAVKAKPDFSEARYNLGLELARAGRVPEALDQFSEVVRLQPGHADAHFNYGVALARQRRFSEAVREFKETLRLQPQHPSAGPMLERALMLAEGEAGSSKAQGN